MMLGFCPYWSFVCLPYLFFLVLPISEMWPNLPCLKNIIKIFLLKMAYFVKFLTLLKKGWHPVCNIISQLQTKR